MANRFKSFLFDNQIISPVRRKLYNYCKIRKYIKGKPTVLCCGIQKCGNTHVWFLLANYIALEEKFCTNGLNYGYVQKIFPSSWSEH